MKTSAGLGVKLSDVYEGVPAGLAGISKRIDGIPDNAKVAAQQLGAMIEDLRSQMDLPGKDGDVACQAATVLADERDRL